MNEKKENYLGYLKSISSDIGELKRGVDDIEKRLDKIEETMNDRTFQRGVDFLERHEGDQESLIDIISKNYGCEKRYSGWELFEKMLEYWAKKLEKNYNFEKELNKTFASKFVEFIWKIASSVIICFILIILSGKTGVLKIIADFFK